MTPAVRPAAAEALGWLVVLALGGVVLDLGLRSRSWPLIHDAPIMHYIAWRIGEGAVPYRDLFDMNFPGVYLLHLLVWKTLGAGDLAWRVFDLAALALAALAVAALAAPFGRLAGAGGALFFAAYHLGGGAWQAGQRDFLLCPSLLLGALGAVRWYERGHRGALFAGAVALGAGVTIKPHALAFVVAVGGLVAFASARRSSPWGALGILAAGVAVVPAAVLVWLAAIGALGPWRDIVFGYLVPFYSRLGRPQSWTVYRWRLWPAIALALVVSIGHALASRRFTFRHAVGVLGIGYGLLHYVGQGKGWEYHLYPLAAFAAVLLLSETAAALRTRPILVGLPLLASLAVVVVVLGQTGVANAGSGFIADKARLVETLTADLRARVRPGDGVQVLDTTDGGIHALLALGIVEPTRFVYDFHFFHDEDQPFIRSLRRELIDALRARPARLIVLFRRGWPSGGAERVERFPELARLLADRYAIVLDRPDYVVYEKRDGS
jgi:hypothetical protein